VPDRAGKAPGAAGRTALPASFDEGAAPAEAQTARVAPAIRLQRER
jgi:hypothetical protein